MHSDKSKTKMVGLTPAEVEESRRKHGANVLTPPPKVPWWRQYLGQFDDPVIRILLIAAALAIVVAVSGHGSIVEGLGIIVAVLLATGLAFLNEFRANKAFDILNKSSDETPIKALRDGNYLTIPLKEVVVGDLLLMEHGEELPADGEVLEAVSFQVDQASLTGESLPVTKHALGDAPKDHEDDEALPADRVYRGTLVSDGHGVIRVTDVGDHTMAGQTARAAAEPEDEKTPLNLQLEKLSKLIGVVAFGVAGATFVALVLRGAFTGEIPLSGGQWAVTAALFLSIGVALVYVWLPVVYDGISFFRRDVEPPHWLDKAGLKGWLLALAGGLALFGLLLLTLGLAGVVDWAPSSWFEPVTAAVAASAELSPIESFLTYFMVAITLIVVAVPEGLAMSVTLSLAYSMRKMTAENNLVRKMRACETIGAATVICSDKTGTLTLNQMHVRGLGFPALPTESPLNDPANPTEVERLIIEGMAANSTAHLSQASGEKVVVLGNPTEGALLRWLHDHKVDFESVRASFALTEQWTFRTERKFMATLGSGPNTEFNRLHMKGAPEIVLGRCKSVLTQEGEKPVAEIHDEVMAQLESYQERGMRTLGFAYLDGFDPPPDVDIEELAVDLVWLGFVAIEDAVRPEVPAAVEACNKAGVQVKIVTGDNPKTAKEIARQIHLWKEDDSADLLWTGRDFAALSDERAVEVARDVKIIARARPLDKLRLVNSLYALGEVVAVTGDGTNDAPALNRAHVGLAMGSGTAVAKEAADIILLDDSFKSIVTGILWGRSLYQNIQRFILFQLTINVAALGTVFLGPFLGVELPLTVIQMLWVNLIMDTLAALALATEPPNPAVMNEPPRDPQKFIITRPMMWGILGTGFFFLCVSVVLLLVMKDGFQTDEATEEGSLFFALFVMAQFWNIFNAKSLGRDKSVFRGLFDNTWFVVIVVVIFFGTILMIQFGGSVFRTCALSLTQWLLVIGSTSIVLWGGELMRWTKRATRETA